MIAASPADNPTMRLRFFCGRLTVVAFFALFLLLATRASIRVELRLDSSPSSPLTAAAAPLMRASQCTTEAGTVSPEIGKFSTALAVSPPHSCFSGIDSPFRLRSVLNGRSVLKLLLIRPV